MITTLKQFINGNIFDAADTLLAKLHITHTKEEHSPIQYADYYDSEVPQYVQNALALTKACYYIGEVCEEALQGTDKGDTSLRDDLDKLRANARYQSMMIFAVDLASEAHVSRSDLSALTRAFNRLVYNFPVTVIFRQGKLLSIATCERTEFKQEWRQGQGEKIGKVSLLRNINCESPHRGHLMVLDEIGSLQFATFDELYANWIKVFSSELLTKKFYSELSDWYAWAVQVVRFPNDLNTTEDDEKFNHESCIRLITRLIFVWFLKQKHLIPEEFFDEDYIRDHFIREFNPHERKTLLYNSENSKYYRLILQNLFFAMLNCPIVAEGKDTPNNRRFRRDGGKGFIREDYNVNNLMRYKSEFMEGGADEFVRIANSTVPFLNGELFECLDEKPDFYYDGFSERKESLEQLYLPDWLFFGDEVGRSIDLSQWYDDKKKRNVSARGIIDILKRYNFTIEENTPLDQEVSLDPELLGKAFENLLASFNPETKTSARKQTGSFYTPREIVQYMVDESLVAHLKRICGDENEAEYRKLLSYDTEETTLNAEQRKEVMKALYNCRVLDPACGSGAFPMGILQQMVHVLRQLDPSNEMWKDFMIDHAIKKSKEAYMLNEEEERKARLADIEEAFNRQVNDPDYARKLYLIEHCIYGVDIQPIAVQISKLRFFISLVVDQRPTAAPQNNFGIRPLPNLESKFVAANTLIPVKYDGTLVENNPEVQNYKKKLKELNHQIFLAKRNVDKQKLKDEIKLTRKNLAQAIENTGFIGHSEAELLAGWDMFDQNASSPYFDAEWMFGVKDGFDIVIGNPPFISAATQNAVCQLKTQRENIIKSKKYKSLYQKWDLYIPFLEFSTQINCLDGITTMIVPFPLTNQLYAKVLRKLLVSELDLFELADLNGTKIFENATVSNCIPIVRKRAYIGKTWISKISKGRLIYHAFEQPYKILIQDKNTFVWNVTENEHSSNRFADMHVLGDYCYISKGMVLYSEEGLFTNKDLIRETPDEIHCRKYIEAKDIERYEIQRTRYIEYDTERVPDKVSRPTFRELYNVPKLITNCLGELKVTVDINEHYICQQGLRIAVLWKDIKNVNNKSIISSIKKYSTLTRSDMEILSSSISLKYLLGIMASKLGKELLTLQRAGDYHIVPEHIRNIPIANASEEQQNKIINIVDDILLIKQKNSNDNTTNLEQKIDLLVYHLYNLTYDEVLIIDTNPPITREEYENYNPNT